MRRSARLRLERAIAADQLVRGAVVLEGRLGRGGQFGDDPLGEDFAELDAPLVERVDVPDDALREHAVLVEGDQFAQAPRA